MLQSLEDREIKHCCVIGGNGFLGTHVIDELVILGRKLTVLDKNPLASEVSRKGVRYVNCDYGEMNLLIETLRGVNEVIHMAYSTTPKTSFDDPVRDIFENLPATVNLIKAASNLGIEKFVFISSGGTIYGKADKVPITEGHPTNPISPYGITKLTCEKYANMFSKLKGLPVVCVRPGNAYGERQKPFTGQGFIATAIVSILRQQEINLFGKTGTIRDYIYVTDVARGIVAALDHGKPGSCYNIGSGIGRNNKSVLDAIYPFASSEGLQPQVKILPPREFDVPVNILDSSKLIKETGWNETVSFEEGIKRTWNWFCHNYSIKE